MFAINASTKYLEQIDVVLMSILLDNMLMTLTGYILTAFPCLSPRTYDTN